MGWITAERAHLLWERAQDEYDFDPDEDNEYSSDPDFRNSVCVSIFRRLLVKERAKLCPIREFRPAWWWLKQHPIFFDHLHSRFNECLSIEVVDLNPLTDEVAEDEALNTRAAVWLEIGPYDQGPGPFGSGQFTHDTDLDCGADSFEEALVRMASLVWAKYGDYDPQERKRRRHDHLVERVARKQPAEYDLFDRSFFARNAEEIAERRRLIEAALT